MTLWEVTWRTLTVTRAVTEAETEAEALAAMGRPAAFLSTETEDRDVTARPLVPLGPYGNDPTLDKEKGEHLGSPVS